MAHHRILRSTSAYDRVTSPTRATVAKVARLAAFLVLVLAGHCDGQNLNPNTKAPNFTLPTLSGPVVYKGIKNNETNIHGPIIFHEFTNHSGFLECLWTKDASILELIDNSPQNTQYVFLTSANDAEGTARWMQNRFRTVLEKYYQLAKNLSTSVTGSVKSEISHPLDNVYSSDLNRRKPNLIQHRNTVGGFPKPKRRIDRRSIDNSSMPDDTVYHHPKAHHTSAHHANTHHARLHRRHSATRRSVMIESYQLPKIRRGRILKHSHAKRSHRSKPWRWDQYEKHHGGHSKKKTTVAKDQSPVAKDQSPVAKEQSPVAKQQLPNDVRSKIAQVDNKANVDARSGIKTPEDTTKPDAPTKPEGYVQFESSRSDISSPVTNSVTNSATQRQLETKSQIPGNPIPPCQSVVKGTDNSAMCNVALPDTSVRSEISKPVASVRSEISQPVASVRSEISQPVASVRSEISQPDASVRSEVSTPDTSSAVYNIYHYDKKGERRSAIYRYTNEVEEDSTEPQDSDSVSLLEARVAGILKKGKEGFINDWLSRLHFVTIPLYQVGNWIPLVMSRWYCSGHGCGLDQISVEKEKEGEIEFVAKRLDARYDWLPSPYTLKAHHPKLKVAYIGNGCQGNNTANVTGQLALISREGACSFYQKMAVAQKAGALGVLVYTTAEEPLVDMTCEGLECENEMKIPGSMIPYGTGTQLLDKIHKNEDVYIRFQHSPSRNFFLAIDEQGKLQEVGWLLYPSMVFLTYQAKWLNYFTNLLSNINSMDARIVNVFNYTNMQGTKGVVKTIAMPPLSELQRYDKVYLDMALGCPGTTDYACPHWDHTVQLYVCCDKTPLCGKEIGRWITPFRRRIGRWLTNITPLIPMFTSTKCKFTMKTVPWAMTWKPALKLRLADAKEGNHSAPYKVIPLFRGGKFDKTYNSKRTPYNFTVPNDVNAVKFFATITGHGSDNNNCAEFCATSHHFVINDKYKNNRVFDSAGTATGCADKVSEGSEPNEHGTWLYGRDGWCDGQNVSPWLEDITSQLNRGDGNHNSISYYGKFNGSDPNPTANPGYMIMYSYLIFYKNVDG